MTPLEKFLSQPHFSRSLKPDELETFSKLSWSRIVEAALVTRNEAKAPIRTRDAFMEIIKGLLEDSNGNKPEIWLLMNYFNRWMGKNRPLANDAITSESYCIRAFKDIETPRNAANEFLSYTLRELRSTPIENLTIPNFKSLFNIDQELIDTFSWGPWLILKAEEIKASRLTREFLRKAMGPTLEI